MSARVSSRSLRPAALGLRRCCSPLAASSARPLTIRGRASVGDGDGVSGARRWRSSIWEKPRVEGGDKAARSRAAPKASGFAFAFE